MKYIIIYLLFYFLMKNSYLIDIFIKLYINFNLINNKNSNINMI